MNLPQELLDSARIDGASDLRVLLHDRPAALEGGAGGGRALLRRRHLEHASSTPSSTSARRTSGRSRWSCSRSSWRGPPSTRPRSSTPTDRRRRRPTIEMAVVVIATAADPARLPVPAEVLHPRRPDRGDQGVATCGDVAPFPAEALSAFKARALKSVLIQAAPGHSRPSATRSLCVERWTNAGLSQRRQRHPPGARCAPSRSSSCNPARPTRSSGRRQGEADRRPRRLPNPRRRRRAGRGGEDPVWTSPATASDSMSSP